MNLITTHTIAALFLLAFISALLTMVVGGIMLHFAERMPEQADIEPGDLGDVNISTNVAVELASMGFEVKSWGSDFQITDADGITFYVPKDSTVEQCLARYAEKVKQFKAA